MILKKFKNWFQESIQCDDASPEVRRGCDFLWLINFFFEERDRHWEIWNKNGSHAFVFFSDFVSDIYFGNKNKDFWYQKELKFLFKDCE